MTSFWTTISPTSTPFFIERYKNSPSRATVSVKTEINFKTKGGRLRTAESHPRTSVIGLVRPSNLRQSSNYFSIFKSPLSKKKKNRTNKINSLGANSLRFELQNDYTYLYNENALYRGITSAIVIIIVGVFSRPRSRPLGEEND